MLLCQKVLDGIAEVSLEVSMAPTDAIAVPDMDPVTDLADTAAVDIKAPTLIMDPAMAPAMALATTKHKNATPPTKSIVPMSRNMNVNIHTKP